MKESLILLTLLLIISETQAIIGTTIPGLRCPLKFFEVDPEHWEPISEGYLLGMHNQTEKKMSRGDCYECRWYGEDMAAVNAGLVHVENMRYKWIDSGRINGANLFDLVNILMEIWQIFLVLLKPMDNIL